MEISAYMLVCAPLDDLRLGRLPNGTLHALLRLDTDPIRPTNDSTARSVLLWSTGFVCLRNTEVRSHMLHGRTLTPGAAFVVESTLFEHQSLGMLVFRADTSTNQSVGVGGQSGA